MCYGCVHAKYGTATKTQLYPFISAGASVLQLQWSQTHSETTFAADLSGTWSQAWLNLFVAAVRVTLWLPIMCPSDMTPTQLSELHASVCTGSTDPVMWTARESPKIAASFCRGVRFGATAFQSCQKLSHHLSKLRRAIPGARTNSWMNDKHITRREPWRWMWPRCSQRAGEHTSSTFK